MRFIGSDCFLTKYVKGICEKTCITSRIFSHYKRITNYLCPRTSRGCTERPAMSSKCMGTRHCRRLRDMAGSFLVGSNPTLTTICHEQGTPVPSGGSAGALPTPFFAKQKYDRFAGLPGNNGFRKCTGKHAANM